MKTVFTIFSLLIFTAGINYGQSNLDISAQVRPRFQMVDKDFNSGLGPNNFTELRTRLGLKFSPVENVTGFVQLQDSRVYGTEPNTLSSIDNIDLHQAYFRIDKLFSLPLNLKVGRFEMVYGPQRLIGAVGWHNVGRSFDGAILQLNGNNVDVDFFAVQTNENSKPEDSLDLGLVGAYGNIKVSKNYKIQPFAIGELQSLGGFKRYTVGLYINGNVGNFSHEVEGAYQLGTMTANVDIAAFMFAFNVKYKFNAPIKPAIGGGIDYLSGDDGKDAQKFKVFNTLYATNHKFYGFMDYFLNIPSHTYGLGLMDIHAKAEFTPLKKFKTAFAFHLFKANADFTLPDESTSLDFGSEIDFTFIYNYNKAVKFQGGFSLFSPGEIFKQMKGEDSSTWGYLMAVVNLK